MFHVKMDVGIVYAKWYIVGNFCKCNILSYQFVLCTQTFCIYKLQFLTCHMTKFQNPRPRGHTMLCEISNVYHDLIKTDAVIHNIIA